MNYIIELRSLEEARIAEQAVLAFRQSAPPPPPKAAHGVRDLADRLHRALCVVPLNAQKVVVIRVLQAAPEADWVSYPTIIEAFRRAGFVAEQEAEQRANAAIRDISWQMGHGMPDEDVKGLAKAIEVFASRVRSNGTFSYRLTPAGRIAATCLVESWLVGESEILLDTASRLHPEMPQKDVTNSVQVASYPSS